MKKIILYALVPISVLLCGCYYSHQYNEETDRECLTDIQNGVNPSEILFKALKGNASPDVITMAIENGGNPAVTIGKLHVPIIAYAKSPKAIKIILDEIGYGEVSCDDLGRTPLFFYETGDLCEAYINGVIENTRMGVYTNMLTDKVFEVTPDTVREDIMKKNDKYGRNPLFYARNREIIDYWLSNGKNINSVDSHGKNPLLYQLGDDNYYNADVMTYFLEKGANVNMGLKEGNITPLGEILRSKRGKDAYDMLISKGAKLENFKNTSNLYYYVISSEQIDLLKDSNLSPNIETSNGFLVRIPEFYLRDIGFVADNKAIVKSPLAKFVVEGNTRIVEALLKAGAKAGSACININDKEVSVLRYSLFIGKNMDITNLLLSYDAAMCKDINAIFSDSVSYSEEIDSSVLIKLIKSNPDVLKTESGIKLFKEFFKRGDIDSVKELIAMGFDINGKNAEGELLWEDVLDFGDFVYRGESEPFIKNFKLLLSLGVDVDLKGSGKETIFEKIISSSEVIKKLPFDIWKSLIGKTKKLNDTIRSKTVISYIVNSECSSEKVEYYLKNGGTLNNADGENVIWNMIVPWRDYPEDIVLTLIRYSDNFDKKVKGKTIITHALERSDISLEIIRALSKKMKSPIQPGAYGIMGKNISPISIAREIGRDDIKQYLMSFRTDIYTKENVLKIKGFYIGMTVDEALNIWRRLEINEPLLCDYDKGTRKVYAIQFKNNALRKMFSIPSDMSIERFVKEFQSGYILGDFSESYDSGVSSLMNLSTVSESRIFRNESEDGILIEIREVKSESALMGDSLNSATIDNSVSWILTMKKNPTKAEMRRRFN